MKPSRIKHVINNLIEQRWPAFLWGPPGIGKSAIVKEVAGENELELLDVRASLLDPTDLRGIPAVVDGKAIWCPPSFLPSNRESKGILFLDEINAAPPLVQASLYQLVLDRRVGEYVLPEGWWIVAAGNRQSDRSVVFRLASALANRFVHLDFEVDLSDWRQWAIRKKIHPSIVSFIAMRPELLLETPGESPAYATPRSWEMASDIIHRFQNIEQCTDILNGTVGEGPTLELAAFAKTNLREEHFRSIVNRPSSAKLPKSLSEVFALTSWLSYHAADPDIQSAAATLLGRMPPEFGVVVAKDMIHASKGFIREEGYKSFMKDHGELFI